MKRFLLLSLAALTMVACNKEDHGQQLDPNATISIRPAPGVRANNPKHVPAIDIVRYCQEMKFWNKKVRPDAPAGRNFGPLDSYMRDTVNVRLLMLGTDVIAQNGELTLDFIEATDVVFHLFEKPITEDRKVDTVAYIPNAVMRDAEKKIKAFYAAGDYKSCYEIFDQTFRFTPITGEEWRALKAQGKN